MNNQLQKSREELGRWLINVGEKEIKKKAIWIGLYCFGIGLGVGALLFFFLEKVRLF